MSEPVLTEIKTRKDPKSALSASHCPRPTHDNRALTFLFNLVQIKQHSYTVSWGAWRPTDGPTRREFSALILWDSGFKRGFLIYYCALLPLTQYVSIGVLVWENCFLDNLLEFLLITRGITSTFQGGESLIESCRAEGFAPNSIWFSFFMIIVMVMMIMHFALWC